MHFKEIYLFPCPISVVGFLYVLGVVFKRIAFLLYLFYRCLYVLNVV